MPCRVARRRGAVVRACRTPAGCPGSGPGSAGGAAAVDGQGDADHEAGAGTAQPQGAEVSRQTSSTVTDNVPEGMAEWRSRPLGTVYPVAFIDAIHEKNRNGAIATRPIY